MSDKVGATPMFLPLNGKRNKLADSPIGRIPKIEDERY